MRSASASSHTSRHIKDVKEKKQRKDHQARLLLHVVAQVLPGVHQVEEDLQEVLLLGEDHHQAGVHQEVNRILVD